MNEWSQEQENHPVPAGDMSASPPAQSPLPTPAPVAPAPQLQTAYIPTPLPQTEGSGPVPPSGTGPTGQPVSQSLWHQRTDGMTLVAGFHFLVAAIFLLGTLIMMIPTGILGIVSVVEDPDAMIAMFIVGGIGILTLGLCLLYLAVGYGLWTLKPWGRVAALALAVVSLFGFPIGTVTGGLTLWYLMQPDVARKFEMA